jgi:serine/threonine protein kinase
MEPDRRPRRRSDLYHAALERPPGERSAFLAAACGSDEALRQEVESLLQYESQSARFLEAPAVAVAGGTVSGTHTGVSMVGHTLGPYTIVAPLGVGGMGEVYRARDTKLGRDVAIKILPPHFTADPERRARFAREARLLATLHHPHISAIYGLEEVDGVTALVLELLEGPTLADRLERGPLPILQALTIARQIAESLDTAHQKGIIHRDLKPANIALQGAFDGLSSDVRAKVLDFGLAKTIEVGLGGELAKQPPGSFDGTADGRILGTPAYMSPEQARGLAVDKRTDIWAFGCVLYEMLAGRRAFDGATITDTLARVLDHEPDWTALPADAPHSIRTLLRRCLRKDPQSRLHDIADARIELDDVDETGAADVARGPFVTRSRKRLAWMTAALLVVAAVGAGCGFHSGSTARGRADSVEFGISPPDGWTFDRSYPILAIAPDGQQLAAVAESKTTRMLWVRPVRGPEWRPLAGTEGATSPFWSCDSRTLGYFASHKLKAVEIGGGGARELADISVGDAAAGTWNCKASSSQEDSADSKGSSQA